MKGSCNMNDHARRIWKAWADGYAVEFRPYRTQNVWVVADPSKACTDELPQEDPTSWRIKPRVKTARFRVALYDGSGDDLIPVTVPPWAYDETCEHRTFVKWVGNEFVIEHSEDE